MRGANADNVGMTERHDELRDQEPRTRLSTGLARDAAEVRAAQRLRWRVFADELHATIDSSECGLDADRYDPWCEHLVVRDDATGQVVGTYRLLDADRAAALGGFYTESEFDCSRLVTLPRLVEVGRACIDPAYRNGAVLTLLWSALAGHIRSRGHEHVIGCASIPVDDGGQRAAAIVGRLTREHLSPPPWRVVPRHAFTVRSIEPAPTAPLPTLLRGYLRMGAWICGPAAYDAAFRTADVVVLLSMARMDRRWAHRWQRAA